MSVQGTGQIHQHYREKPRACRSVTSSASMEGGVSPLCVEQSSLVTWTRGESPTDVSYLGVKQTDMSHGGSRFHVLDP